MTDIQPDGNAFIEALQKQRAQGFDAAAEVYARYRAALVRIAELESEVKKLKDGPALEVVR